QEIRMHLQVPVLGHIPVMSRELLAAARGPLDGTLCAFHAPRSMAAEAYRGIRTALFFPIGKVTPKIIQVTSSDSGDGKSTLIASLAGSFGRSGRRVVVVDTDFRRSAIHGLFGLASQPGLSALVEEDADILDVIQQTAAPNVYAIVAGSLPDNPAELLSN